MSFEAISESLNTNNNIIIVETKPIDQLPAVVIPTSSENEDFIYVRDHYKELMNVGQTALAGAFESARETGKASSYDSVSNMIKVLTELGEKMYNLHKLKKDLLGENPDIKNQNINVDKGIIVGNSADVFKMIRENVTKK